MKMTTEEAFVTVPQMHGIEHASGITGSAFMPISDLFAKAGINIWDCAHQGSAVKAACWNHRPLLLVTPQAASKTMGQGGFQEVEQMAFFKDMACYQEGVRDLARLAEVLNRVILQARRQPAPAPINFPHDCFTQVIDIEVPMTVEFEPPWGGEET